MIEYRPAEPLDAQAIAHLHAQSWRENYRGSFRDEFLDGDLPNERLRVWRERLDRSRADQLVALAHDGGSLVGFVCVYGAEDPRWGSLVDNLHVAARAKRSGIGSSLMRQAGAWLSARYPELGIYLFVLEVNVSARRFYERLGAENSGASSMETHGGSMVRSCRYTWRRPELLTSRAKPRSE
jgi:ribosomal protein S18 acetylase RimI-like enzyme